VRYAVDEVAAASRRPSPGRGRDRRELPGAAAWALLLAVAVALVMAVPASGAAHGNPCAPAPPDAAVFGANSNHVGVVDLHFFTARGAAVTYYECLGGRAHLLGDRTADANSPITSFFAATQWRCGRLERQFAATATLSDGSFVRGITGVRTMSCAHRFALELPHSVALGREAHLRVVDRWGIGGIHTRLCLTVPGAARSCQGVGFAAAATVVRRVVRARQRGVCRVELEVDSFRVRGSIAFGEAAVAVRAPPTLLATGDSTMQGVESFLADDLGDTATVVSEVHPGYGISSGSGWAPTAADQVARLHPRTTVISLGAAEGSALPTADGTRRDCCSEAWVAAYARRVRQTMLIYREHGLARVIYLTVAAPRGAARAVVVSAVNAGILRAAVGLHGVTVLRMDLLFSPHGYQEILRYGGRDVHVREADGVHLNVSGTAIEAHEVARALRAG